MKTVISILSLFLILVSIEAMAASFMSDELHIENLERQVEMTPRTLKQLRAYGVSEDNYLKLEYFFYTDQESNAQELNAALIELGYDSKFGVSAASDELYLITGWTTPIRMRDKEAVTWTSEMCELGYKYDAEFDGWGTNPDQD